MIVYRCYEIVIDTKLKKEQEFKLVQTKSETVELNNAMESVLSVREQELVQLRLAVRRAEDAKKLAEHDLERTREHAAEVVILFLSFTNFTNSFLIALCCAHHV